MGKDRFTLGFITETGFLDFENQLLDGVVKASREKDINIVMLAIEHEYRDKTYKHQMEYIYSILEKISLDGLIFLGWSLPVIKNERYFLDRILSIKKIPLVSLGRKIENIPSVIMDTENQIAGLLSHLYDRHGYRNIVFIPPLTPDDRFGFYERFMKKHGIFNPELVIKYEECFIENDYYHHKRAGRIAELLFRERKVPVEAIISCYSLEAFLLIENITEMGLKVPGDVAVASWEDSDKANYSDIPITSVYYPFFEIGYRGCMNAAGLAGGADIPLLSLVPGRLNIRKSCGCETADVLNETGPAAAGEINYHELSLEKLRGIIGMDDGDYLKALEDYIDKIFENDDFYIHVRALTMVHDIQKEILNFHSDIFSNKPGPALESKADKMLVKVLLMLQRKTEQVLVYSQSLKMGTSEMIQDTSHNIVITQEIGKINRMLSENMLKLEVMSYLLFFNLRSTNDIKLKKSGIAYSFRKGKNRTLDKLPAKLDGLLYPDNSRHLYYFHILHIKSSLLGFIFFEPNLTDERIYYSFSIQLSSALHGSLTLENLKTARDEIAINLKEIEKKTRELERSNEKLAQLDNLKNDFITNVTHDFRNPLTVILNLSDLSLKYPMDLNETVTFERFNTIYSASVALKHSIDQLLDIAKIDASGMKLHIRKIPLRSYLEGIINFYRSAASSYRIKIIRDLPEKEIEEFYSDLEKLDEIFHNIISNAIKFVEPGSGIIKIVLKDMGRSIQAIIEDNGIGIPPDKLDFIFGRFEQIRSGERGRNKGTGIGLFFSRQLVSLLNGSLKAESEGPGKGARFILELKKGKDNFDYSGDMAVFENEPGLTFGDSREYYRQIVKGTVEEKSNKKFHASIKNPNLENEFNPLKAGILIVDDNIEIHNILKSYLSNWGYSNFIHAYDGSDGLEGVYRYKPDLIICDYNMPKMRGDEMQDILINNPEFRNIPMIFLSAVVDKDLIMKGKEKGAIVYLKKPIDERELMVNVEYFLLKQMEFKQLLLKSSVDELTGLSNKVSITGFLHDHLMIRAYRPLSIIMMDIDNFKSINDMYGHLTGDNTVMKVGKAIKNTIRNYDRAGRFGGDEFLIVLPETALREAGLVSEKLRKSIQGLKLKAGDSSLQIAASFGVSSLIDNEKAILSRLGIDSLKEIFEIDDKKNTDWEMVGRTKNKIMEILIELADKALYNAKRTGRNKIELSPRE